jgi:hypothetical protein
MRRRGAVALRLLAPCSAVVAGFAPTIASAHGNVTGPADYWQDYGVAIFMALVLIVGAGVLLWVLLAPLPIEPADESAPHDARSDLNKPRGIENEDRRTSKGDLP